MLIKFLLTIDCAPEAIYGQSKPPVSIFSSMVNLNKSLTLWLCQKGFPKQIRSDAHL